MIANFFNKSKPVIIFNLIAVLFLFYVVSGFMLNFEELTIWFFLKKGMNFIGLVLLLLLVNFIVKKNNLTLDNSYTLLIHTLLLGTFYFSMHTSEILFVNLLLLLSYRKIYSIKSGFNIGGKLFDAGFWIGTASLIYPPSILFVVLIYIAILIYQKLYIQNFIIPIIGVLTPVLLFFTYAFFTDNVGLFFNNYSYPISFDFSVYNNLNYLIAITFLITIVIWSVFVVSPKIITAGSTMRMSWNIVLNQLLIAAIITFAAPIKNGSEFLFLLFPSAVIITNFLQKSQSKNFKSLILYLFVAISIAVYFL